MRALLVGRFQPPHRGHLHAIRAAARRHGRVLVAIGSAQRGHEPDNPLTVAERFDLLRGALEEAGLRRVHVYAIPDLHRHAAWVAHVEALVPRFDVAVTNNPLTRRLFASSGYRVEPVAEWRPDACSGRRIRARWAQGDDADALLPPSVAAQVRRLRVPERVRRLTTEVASRAGR